MTVDWTSLKHVPAAWNVQGFTHSHGEWAKAEVS